jgi:hypothetical protein
MAFECRILRHMIAPIVPFADLTFSKISAASRSQECPFKPVENLAKPAIFDNYPIDRAETSMHACN